MRDGVYCLSTQQNVLDFLVSLLLNIDVANLSEIQRKLYDQLLTESARLKGLYDEESLLRSSVDQYRKVRNDIKVAQRRAKQLAALVGPGKLKKQKGIDPEVLKQAEESMTRVALWPAIGLILEQERELRIVELYQTLQKLGFKASRQAVESAIDYHKETFETRTTDKREKFVSLR